MRDDFHLDATYDGGDENEWDDNEDNWNGDEEEAIDEGVMESKDENKAYLEFLNEEVCEILRACLLRKHGDIELNTD